MLDVKIEKGVPVPPPREIRRLFPFRDMETGESFFVPMPKKDYAKRRLCIQNNAWQWSRKLGAKFVVRDVIEDGVKGVRIWRV